MLKSLSEVGADEMRAASAHLQEIQDAPGGFSDVSQAHFSCAHKKPLLLAGKNVPETQHALIEVAAWNALDVEFDRAAAAGFVVTGRLREMAVRLTDFTLEETRGLADLTADWLMRYPFSLPILVAISGKRSRKKFKADLNVTNASDKKIGSTDAIRIVEAMKGVQVPTAPEILAALESTIEGIVRDQIGKAVNESVVSQALNARGLEGLYVRDEGGTKCIEGVLGASRADFAFPCNVEPKAFIEVRKSTSNHAAMYAHDLMWSVANRNGKHKGILAVFVYDGIWSKTTLTQLREAFDHVFHVSESDKAAEVVWLHAVEGKNQQKPGLRLTLGYQ